MTLEELRKIKKSVSKKKQVNLFSVDVFHEVCDLAEKYLIIEESFKQQGTIFKLEKIQPWLCSCMPEDGKCTCQERCGQCKKSDKRNKMIPANEMGLYLGIGARNYLCKKCYNDAKYKSDQDYINSPG